MAEQSERDMSPEAIDRRLREVSELHELGMMLSRFKLVGAVDAPSGSGLDAPVNPIAPNSPASRGSCQPRFHQ
jgi:hypothetical protein